MKFETKYDVGQLVKGVPRGSEEAQAQMIGWITEVTASQSDRSPGPKIEYYVSPGENVDGDVIYEEDIIGVIPGHPFEREEPVIGIDLASKDGDFTAKVFGYKSKDGRLVIRHQILEKLSR